MADAIDQLTLVGLDHHAASMEAVEAVRARVAGDLVPPPGLAGGVALATCHRLELYLEGALPALPEEIFRAWLGVERRGGVTMAGWVNVESLRIQSRSTYCSSPVASRWGRLSLSDSRSSAPAV